MYVHIILVMGSIMLVTYVVAQLLGCILILPILLWGNKIIHVIENMDKLTETIMKLCVIYIVYFHFTSLSFG